MSNNLVENIKNTIKEYSMFQHGDTVLVGVSGGADSMALLSVLIMFQKELQISVEVAHIEHGIRGKDSLDDAKFVEEFCNKNCIKFHLKHIDALSLAKESGKSVEEISREKRYEFFSSLNCTKIATAHSLSDNVETILFRLSRGTSLKGVCGIPAVRDNIVRPLINVSGDDIRSYCKDNNIAYRVDATNFQNDYSRNYIRNVIVPEFKSLNPSFENVAARFISSAITDENCLEGSAQWAYSLCCTDKKINCEKLKTFHLAEISRMLRMFFAQYGITADYYHTLEIAKLVFDSGKIQLSKSVFAVSDGKYLWCEKNKCENDIIKYEYEVLVVSVKEFLNIRELSQKKIDFYCDCDKISGNVIFRARQEGDKISPAGRSCTKSLKKLFNELHIPINKRNENIVAADDKSVIGIMGHCCDERVKVSNSTKNVYIAIAHTEDD